jgi:hypothetical protein
VLDSSLKEDWTLGATLTGTGTFTKRNTARASASACEFVRPFVLLAVSPVSQSFTTDRTSAV